MENNNTKINIPTPPCDHKLCGFLTTLLRLTPPLPPLETPLHVGTPLALFSHGASVVGLRSQFGHVLFPLRKNHRGLINQTPNSKKKGVYKKRKSRKSNVVSNGKKRKDVSNGTVVDQNEGIGGGGGSGGGGGVLSVVNQIKTLVNQKCLRIVATVVGVLGEKDGDHDDDDDEEVEVEVRVVVLVDVYLPEAVWRNDWQFPRSNTTAAALFRHLSCDWKERDAMLNDDYYKDALGNKSLVDVPFCHVLGCKQHSNISDSPKTTGLELQEIFKSLPSLAAQIKTATSSIAPDAMVTGSGIWDLTDDILIQILGGLCPMDLKRVSVTCHRLRFLSASVLPCIKLKLFPHQQAAVEWMVQREHNVAVLNHPLYLEFLTKDDFSFHINIVSGELATGPTPTINDFRGGLFCDEPGLGKTITALSLISKTQGTLADPPEGTEVIMCSDSGDKKCGFYECSGSRYSDLVIPSPSQKSEDQNDRMSLFSPDELIPEDYLTPKKSRLSSTGELGESSVSSCPQRLALASSELSQSTLAVGVLRCSRSLSRVKKNLFQKVEDASGYPKDSKTVKYSGKRKRASNNVTGVALCNPLGTSCEFSSARKRQKKSVQDYYVEDWITCDSCGKWRRVPAENVPDPEALWFCNLNPDPDYQSCNVPEETSKQPLMYLPGFCSQEGPEGLPQNVAFFISVLKDHYALLNGHTKKALRWLARLPSLKLSEMENIGLVRPGQVTTKEANSYRRIFEAFGFIMKKEKGTVRWFYPKSLNNLVFDLPALRIALCEPLDSYKMYLSRATLIVVPSNLVDHWRTQIEKHVKPGQLNVYVWADHKKPPSVHNLAWDYDVVITTFTRLSSEWNPRKVSVLMQVHWMRVMLDEGHTLGSSMNLTNKMQMAVSLRASNRWILTGTPTPNTPSSQVSHLQPMLKFLHDEVFGKSPKNWEAGILKPFEAEMEDGKLRLIALLRRCMISARKTDLRCIPPCIKKTTFVEFTKEHAKTYNELVVTVRRNILMADWEDPNHVESLLNPKQWKLRTALVRNVRLSCCVAGHIKVVETGQDIQETMDDLVKIGLEPLSQEYALIKYNLSYGGNCQRCEEWCRLPIITPCRHLLCLDCAALDSEKCPLDECGFKYEMQIPDVKRLENPNPLKPVPKDLIELQPSYKQDNWDSDWRSTSSSKVAYLVQRLKDIEAGNRQIASSMDEGMYTERPYVSESCQLPWGQLIDNSSKVAVEKVLVFSQFLEHILVIEQQLENAGIRFTGMYSSKSASSKKKSLADFQRDPSCMVLVMDGTAALGLDLSFVTYVFLMEPIWDRSMEEQVISRAHRMGAMRPIHVETLAMRGTIEEQMLNFLQNPEKYRSLLKEDHENTFHEGTRAHRSLHDFAEREYLTLLRMVRPGAQR